MAHSRSIVPCSSTPARRVDSTSSRLRDSMTTEATSERCSKWDSVRPAGPAPTIATCVRAGNGLCIARLGRSGLLARILDRVELVELDVPQLAIALLDLAQVDRLHDVARLGIDRDRTTRA